MESYDEIALRKFLASWMRDIIMPLNMLSWLEVLLSPKRYRSLRNDMEANERKLRTLLMRSDNHRENFSKIIGELPPPQKEYFEVFTSQY